MKPCELCDAYLDAGLRVEDKAAFEKHLSICRDCLERVNDWRTFERGVNRWAELKKAPPVTAGEAAVLVQRAASRSKSRSGGLPMFVGIGAAAAAAVVAMLVLPGGGADSDEALGTAVVGAPTLAVVTGLGDEKVTLVAGESMVAKDRPVTASIDKDTVALSSKGKMRLVRLDRGAVRLSLDTGTVSCRVDKRQPDEDFVVEAGGYAVRVVGTRFSVTKGTEGISVVVREGAVRVEKDGKHWMLHAGDTLEADDATPVVSKADDASLEQVDALFDPVTETPVARPSEEAVSTVPEEAVDFDITESEVAEVEDAHVVETLIEKNLTEAVKPKKEAVAADISGWRQSIVAGKVDKASEEMRLYLKRSPKDSRVWALYADATRKQQAWPEAVRAYKRVIELSDGPDASRAMYMLASLYQKPLRRHQDAVDLFRTYKKTGHVSAELAELTDVKIAKSLVALGQCDAARKAVAHLLNQSGSFVAENAKKMVESCGRGDPSLQ